MPDNPPVQLRMFETPESGSAHAAAEIAKLIRERAAEGRQAVLGLATGGTMLPFYEELVRLHREENLSFENLITFNLDEYLDLDAEHPHSLRTFMDRHFFDRVNVPAKQIHFLTGNATHPKDHCAEYEQAILAAGGIDIQMLGIGRNGHIGFNEPGSTADSRTREVSLAPQTRDDAAKEFGGIEKVPPRALTMGCATILEARRILLLAWGEGKREIVRRAIEGCITADVPASHLRQHPDAEIYVDGARPY